jgi:broad-specificity NMP kinase
MIIELYGLPGSGKTTLAETISRARDLPIVRIENRREILLYNFLFLMAHPVKYLVSFGYLVRGSANLKMFNFKFLSFFLNRNAKYQKAQESPSAVIDEGHIQNMISFFEAPVSEKQLRTCLKYAPMPDLLIVLELTREELESVVEGRAYTIRKGFGRDYLSGWLESMQRNNETLRDIIPSLDVRHVVVDARRGSGQDDLFALLPEFRNP